MSRTKIVVMAAMLALAALAVWYWQSRPASDAAENDAAVHANGAAETNAAIARVQRRTLGATLSIAGEFKPFQDVDVHAKVAGYIRRIYVDVGDHVKEGQILAVLEVPELAAQLTGAEAAVRVAQDLIFDVDDSNHIAGVWLLNVPPFPTDQ